MSMVVPDAQELVVINAYLAPALSLKLYSNNATPVGTSVAADFTQTTGGGYASKPLTFANWNIVSGDPTVATYNASQEWTFTGAVGGTGLVYGYYVTRDSDGLLMWAERFNVAVIPFTPEAGSLIRILPKFDVTSVA